MFLLSGIELCCTLNTASHRFKNSEDYKEPEHMWHKESKKDRFILYRVYSIEMSEQLILTIRENQSPSDAIHPTPEMSSTAS